MTQVISLFGMTLPVREGGAAADGAAAALPGDRTGRRRSRERQARYRYNEDGLPVEVTYPDGSRRSLAYDEQGRLRAETDQAGQTTRYTYDDKGRLTGISYADGRRARWTYDERGRLTTIADPVSATTYDYDEAGLPVRQTVVIDGQAFVTDYAYDDEGRMNGIRPPGSQRWLHYTYDDEGRLAAVHGEDGGDAFVTHDYDDDRVRSRFGNGVVTEHGLCRPYPLRRIRTWLPGCAQPLLDLRLVYDGQGNVLRAGQRRFYYDERGQLASARDGAQTVAYSYDRAGNRTEQRQRQGETTATTTYSYDALDRLQRETDADGSAHDYTYDRCGRLVRRKGPEEMTVYRYDAGGRLVEVVRTGVVVVRYRYNAQGHRVSVTMGGETIIEHRDPAGLLLAETTAAGRVLATYVRAGGRVVAVIAGPVGCRNIRYYHLDHLGSTLAVTDEQGDLSWRGRYRPFGETDTSTGEMPRAGFGGYQFQVETGLYYAGARWHDPRLGRFLTPDSYTYGPDDPRRLWTPGGRAVVTVGERDPRRRNRYIYCLNNPATYVDLDGHDALGVFLTIIGFIWALPSTVFGCLLWLSLEILNVIALILSLTGVFQSLGVSGHGSDDLETFGLFFEGGMIGSIMKATTGGAWKAFTSGYTVFIQESEASVQSTICHELRHTNQYGWFGPFFALPALIAPIITLPTLGLNLIFDFIQSEPLKLFLLAQTAAPLATVYFWDVVVNGYNDAWAEKDAQAFEGGC